MVECKHRIALPSQDNAGIEDGMEKVFGAKEIPSIYRGKSKQNWQNGMCAILTRINGGPMACYQPEHSEETCPDIQ